MDSINKVAQLQNEFFEDIQTARLKLRKLSMTDCEQMFLYTSKEEAFQYLKRNPHVNITQTQEFVQDVLEKYAKNLEFIWGIESKATGVLLGTCRLFNINVSDKNGEVSYMISPAYAGEGYATEAINAVCEFAFERIGFIRIQAHCVEENVASEKVMQKCGMCYEGTLKNYAIMHGIVKSFKLYAKIKQ